MLNVLTQHLNIEQKFQGCMTARAATDANVFAEWLTYIFIIAPKVSPYN